MASAILQLIVRFQNLIPAPVWAEMLADFLSKTYKPLKQSHSDVSDIFEFLEIPNALSCNTLLELFF